MRYRDVLEEVQPHWGIAASLIAAAATTYGTMRASSNAKKARAMQAAAMGDNSGGGMGSFEPSAAKLAEEILGAGQKAGMEPNAFDKQMDVPYRDAVPPQPATGFSQEASAPAPSPAPQPTATQPGQQPPPQQEKVPYDQYASLASTAAQIAQLFMPQGANQSSPIPQATMGPYTPTAGMFTNRRQR